MVHTALKFVTIAGAVAALQVGAAHAQSSEPSRELGAHQHGRGTFSMEFDHYEPVSPEVAKRVRGES